MGAGFLSLVAKFWQMDSSFKVRFCFYQKNGLIHGLIPVWMLTIHLLVFCFVKLRENLFLNLPKSRVPTPIF